MSHPQSPQPPRKPNQPPSAKPAPPRKARPEGAAPAGLPVGKPIASAAVRAVPPPMAPPPVSVGATGSAASAYLGRKKSNSIGTLIGLGMGGVFVVVCVVLASIYYGGTDENSQQANAGDSNTAPGGGAPAADAASTPAGDPASPTAANPSADSTGGAEGAAPGPRNPATSPDPASKVKPPPSSGRATDTPSDPEPERRALPYRSFEEIPEVDMPPELAETIRTAIATLDTGKVEDLIEKLGDPEERQIGLQPRREMLPEEFMHRGVERANAAYQTILQRKPRMVDDGTVAIFPLSQRTRPTFVRRGTQWYISRGHAVQVDTRLVELSPAERIQYELERLSGAKAVPGAEAMQRSGEELQWIGEFTALGAHVAASGPDDTRQRSAVLLGAEFRGGDDALERISKLVGLEVIIIEDAPNISANGLLWLDGVSSLRYVKCVGITLSADLPIARLLADLPRLERAEFDGGSMDETNLRFMRDLLELKHVAIAGQNLTDHALDYFADHPHLHTLIVDARERTISADAAARLRARKAALWVEW
jgi:hypothetical protein